MDTKTQYYAGWPAFSQYVIARHRKGHLELLRISLEAGDKALLVFSFEEVAQEFLEHRALEPEWHIREFYNGELISLLYGPWTDIKRVLPNPLPNPLAAQDALLNSIDRESFIGFLLEQRVS